MRGGSDHCKKWVKRAMERKFLFFEYTEGPFEYWETVEENKEKYDLRTIKLILKLLEALLELERGVRIVE